MVIHISNPEVLTYDEKIAILATHTADVTFNSFAAEVEFHSDALLDFKAFFDKWYNSALRADVALGEEYESGLYDKYYDLESDIVKAQIAAHGEY